MTTNSSNHSTNPFDGHLDYSFTCIEEKEDEDRFFDCQQPESATKKKDTSGRRRSAILNFDNPFDDVEQPALNFNLRSSPSEEFFSPLENAMMQFATPSPAKRNSGAANTSEDDRTEDSRLLASSRTTSYSGLTSSPGRSRSGKMIPTEIRTDVPGGADPAPGRRRSRRSSIIRPGVVMKGLADGENEFSVDYKYIVLEDLGTASSWLILLLPYFAFVICLVLESARAMKVSTTDPMLANSPCQIDGQSDSILPPPQSACYSIVPVQAGHNPLFRGSNTTGSDRAFVFDSAIMDRIPVVSTFLYGDATYSNLSTDAVSLVAKGMLEYTVKLYQRITTTNSDGDDEWSLLFSSEPNTVSMACTHDGYLPASSKTKWNCKSPRLVDVVFSMPETAVYAGNDIRVNVFYSVSSADVTLSAEKDSYTSIFEYSDTSYVYTKARGAADLFASTNVAFPLSATEEIVKSSSYTFEHMSEFAMKLDTGVRLASFILSVLFVFYWFNNIGIKSRCCGRDEDPSSPPLKKASLWWESPWILFPERCYIVILLFSLLLMQEPVLALIVFVPALGASTRLHVAADATIGIGVHGVLFVYLCLFHGFRYHTAAVAKKRAEHQRQNLQLRRAAKYVARNSDKVEQTEEGIKRYTDEYYDRFGDIDGSSSIIHLRLANDPFGDGWADFLVFKLLLFVIGVASVIATAYCRFPPDDQNVAYLSSSMLEKYKQAYVVSILVQFAVLLAWMYLIVDAAFISGRKLRTEPFLGTRPAQLAYRILFAHMTLGFMALAVSFFFNLTQLLRKWSLQNPSEDALYPIVTHEEELSRTEMMIRVLSEVARQFPYSGTAASVGSGRIIFATVSILITAFIFLPTHTLDEEYDDEPHKTTIPKTPLQIQRRLRRDKRRVVHLAKTSRTWRVFPIPIERSTVQTTQLQDEGYQLYKDLSIEEDNTRDRGVVSVGPYMPLFCLEIAYWLNEASWQTYYTPAGINRKKGSTGAMNLDPLGLRLEGAVYDEVTDTQAYVATNISPQVDGDADSIIVVAFRGTVSASNLHTDFRSKQVPLMDQIAGIGAAPFCIYPDRLEIYDNDGWLWESTPTQSEERIQCVTSWTSSEPGCIPYHIHRNGKSNPLTDAISKGARAVLKATPVARSSFPLVHVGFQEVYKQIRRQLLDLILPVMQRQLERALEVTELDEGSEPLALPKIYVTGHSLGGSLAQLLALDLANNCEIVLPGVTKMYQPASDVVTPEDEVFILPTSSSNQDEVAPGTPKRGVGATTTTAASPASRSFLSPNKQQNDDESSTVEKECLRLQPPIAVYTFGQPRVGNKTFSRLYKQRVPHSFRIVNEGDAITSMPNVVFCGGIYKHAGLEVLLDEGMTGNILVGPNIVETMFRFHQVRTNVLAHTMYRYRDCLVCAFEEHELQQYYQGRNVIISKDMNNVHGMTTMAGGGGGGGGGGGMATTTNLTGTTTSTTTMTTHIVSKNATIPGWMTQIRSSSAR